MIRRLAPVVVSLVCLLAATALSAAEDVLKLVPESAQGLVVVNRLADLDSRLQAAAQELQLPLPSLMGKLKEMNVTDGLDENGSAAFVFLPSGEMMGPPAPLMLVPVTDYAKFLAGLKPEDAKAEVAKVMLPSPDTCVRKVGNYAAMTDSKHRAVIEKLTVASEIPAAFTHWKVFLGKSDVAVMILPVGIKQLCAMGQMGLQMAKMKMSQLPGEQGKQAVAAMDLYGQLLQKMPKEVTALGIALQLDKQHVLRLATRTSLAPEGHWAALVDQMPHPENNLLEGLPGQTFFMAGGAAFSEQLCDAMIAMAADMIKAMPNLYDLSPEQVAKMPQHFAAAKYVKSVAMMMGIPKENEPLYAAMVGAVRVDDSAAYMAAYEKDMKNYGEFLKGSHSPMLRPIAVTKDDVGGTPGLRLTTEMPQTPAGPAAAATEHAMEAMFGPGGKISVWVAPAGDKHVVFGYVSKEHVAEVAAAIKQGKADLTADEDVAKTTALLQRQAAAVGFISPAGTVKFIARALPAFVPSMNAPPNLPELTKTPIGFSVSTASHEVRTLMVVPGEVLKSIVGAAGAAFRPHAGSPGPGM
jgi:hypothetical protein